MAIEWEMIVSMPQAHIASMPSMRSKGKSLIPCTSRFSSNFPIFITKKKNVSVRTSKRQDARNRSVRPVCRERAVLHLGARRKYRWILRPAAISQSFTFLLQSRKALRSGWDFCPIHVPTLLHSTLTPQRYIWRILHHVEDSCTFTFITHRCNIWLGT